MNVVITGASRGLGRAIAEIFLKQDYHVLLTAMDAARLNKTQNELQQQFPSATIKAKAFDISKKEQVGALAAWCLREGVVDILVNNAGSFTGGNVHNEEDGALEMMIETNLYSAYHLTRMLLPGMMKRKSGHIFNMASIAGLKAYPGGGAYSISKYALRGFSVNLREELKQYQIKVTTVYPGAVYTDSWKGQVPQERIMESADIAKMIFAASRLSPQACVEDIVVRPQLGDL